MDPARLQRQRQLAVEELEGIGRLLGDELEDTLVHRRHGGVEKVAPVLAGLFLVAGLATLGLPGLSPFVSEFLVLLAAFQYAWYVGAIAITAVVLAAIYVLWMYQRTMTGPTPPHVVAKLIEAASKPQNHRYSVSRGIYKLRLAIVAWYKRRYNVETDYDTRFVVHRSCGVAGCSSRLVPITVRTDYETVELRTVYEHVIEIRTGRGAKASGSPSWAARRAATSWRPSIRTWYGAAPAICLAA